MDIDVEKFKQMVEESLEDISGFCISSETCIYMGADDSGNPIQITIKATSDESEMIDEPNGDYICITTE